MKKTAILFPFRICLHFFFVLYYSPTGIFPPLFFFFLFILLLYISNYPSPYLRFILLLFSSSPQLPFFIFSFSFPCPQKHQFFHVPDTVRETHFFPPTASFCIVESPLLSSFQSILSLNHSFSLKLSVFKTLSVSLSVLLLVSYLPIMILSISVSMTSFPIPCTSL